jgi:hypothetical protein
LATPPTSCKIDVLRFVLALRPRPACEFPAGTGLADARRRRNAMWIAMPHLRLLTWNAGGEADGRGAALDATIVQINLAIVGLPAPANTPIQAFAIQEANQAPNGNISVLIAAHVLAGAGTFSQFTAYHISEHHALQTNRVGVSKGYIVALKTAGPSAVVPVVPPANMIGANAGAGPLYRIDLWNDPGANASYPGAGGPLAAVLRMAQRHMRWPVFICFTVGGVNVVLVTVHLEMKANWLGAVALPNPWAQGLKEAIQLFFQSSTWYANALGWIGANGLIVLAGDLNGNAAELSQPGILPTFDGTSDNLSHILAHSPGAGAGGVSVVNHWAQQQNFPPHHILTAGIGW